MNNNLRLTVNLIREHTMKKQYVYQTLLLSTLLSTVAFSWSISSPLSTPNTAQPGSSRWVSNEVSILKSQAGNIDSNVLRLSLVAYTNAHKRGLVTKPLLTVIDYSKPANEKRLWVFNVKSNKTLFNTWVSHGKNSGGINATSFSNSPGSLKSSIGVFVTEQTYDGKNGYSLHLKGLERGVNDNAYNRDIVIHGAWYVNPDTISRYGQIGRSWGCPAVSKTLSTPIINTIKDDTVVFAYYPDRSWLSHSQFLSA